MRKNNRRPDENQHCFRKFTDTWVYFTGQDGSNELPAIFYELSRYVFQCTSTTAKKLWIERRAQLKEE